MVEVSSLDEATLVDEENREIAHTVAHLHIVVVAPLQHHHTMVPLVRRMTPVHPYPTMSQADLEIMGLQQRMKILHTVLHHLSAATIHLQPHTLAPNASQPITSPRYPRSKKVAKRYRALWILRQRNA